MNGPRYTLLLNGKGHKPRLDLSFLSHDFGPCLVWQPGMRAATKVLRLTNNDSQPLSVDAQYSEAVAAAGPDAADVWELNLPACILQPGESCEGTLAFRPLAETLYALRLPLEVNGLYRVSVDLHGEGVPVRVEPVDATQRSVNFGAVSVLLEMLATSVHMHILCLELTDPGCPASLQVPKGQSSTRSVSIINRGRCPVHLSLGRSAEMLQRRGIDVLPASPVLLRSRETVDLSFFYRPAERVRPWSEQLVLDADGAALHILMLTGACQGTQLVLASDALPFGPVVLGSSASKRLALENAGDVGTKYTWDTRTLAPNFTISPADGFLVRGVGAPRHIAHCSPLTRAFAFMYFTSCAATGSRADCAPGSGVPPSGSLC